MLKSMTGFGKATAEINHKKVTIEVRSLNSKQLDLNLRMPSFYREKENEIRSELNKTLDRGKIDFTINVDNLSEGELPTINKTLAKAYHQELKSLAQEFGEDPNHMLSLVMRMPEVMKAERAELTETEWKSIMEAIQKAVENLNTFRKEEGAALANELKNRIDSIREHLNQVVKLDPERIQTLKDRLQKNLEENIDKQSIDHNRFEQELIYYIEKFDITEEKVRLKTHCDYFLSTMQENGAGRKLGFIAQEIGREINTIGSKSNHAEIQKLVVQMKDELEKIKEQSLNVL